MVVKLTAVVTRAEDEDLYVARAVEVDIASQGYTLEEALANLREAVELYFEDEEDAPADCTLKFAGSGGATIAGAWRRSPAR